MLKYVLLIMLLGVTWVGSAQDTYQAQPANATPTRRAGFFSNFRRPTASQPVQPTAQQQVVMPEENLPVDMPERTPKAATKKATTAKPVATKAKTQSTSKAIPESKQYNMPEKKVAAATKKPTAAKSADKPSESSNSSRKTETAATIAKSEVGNDILNASGSQKPESALEAKSNEPEPKSDGKAQPHVASTAGASSVVTNWPTGKKLVALTYDDGPNPKITPKLLELLASKKAKATFYLLGNQLKAYPSIAAEIAAQGHELANHTTTHKQLSKLDASSIRSEIAKTDDMLTSITGTKIPTMRPPYGAHNERVRQVCADLGYKVILWDVDTNDWRPGKSSQTIINTIMSGTSDGSIILLHDRYQSTLDSTAYVIDALRQKGYEFVTVSELLSHQKTSGITASAVKSSTPAATTQTAQ